MKKKTRPFVLRALLGILGAFIGGFYVLAYFGGAFYLYYRAVSPANEKTMLLLLGGLGVLGIVLFFVLSHFVAKWIKGGRYAFPIGAFLVSDGGLVSVFLLKLMDPEKMIALAGGSTDLAKSYLYGMMVMIAIVTIQVVCWLITLLFAAFRYFQRVNFSTPAPAPERGEIEAELRAKIEAELRATLMKQNEEKTDAPEAQAEEIEENGDNA